MGKGWHRTAQGSHSKYCCSLRANTSAPAGLKCTFPEHTHLVTHKLHAMHISMLTGHFHNAVPCTICLPEWKISIKTVENKLTMYNFGSNFPAICILLPLEARIHLICFSPAERMSKEPGDCSRGEVACWCFFEVCYVCEGSSANSGETEPSAATSSESS